MNHVLIMACWSVVLVWAARQPAAALRWWAAAAIALAVSGSAFWHHVAWAVWNSEPLPLASPHVAFISAWVITARALLWRLETETLTVNGFAAVTAAAACGLAVDSAAALAACAPWLTAPARFVIAALLLGPAGYALGTVLAQHRHIGWEYTAWYAAWLAMAASFDPAHARLTD